MKDTTAPKIPTRIIEFAYLDHLEVVIRPAVLDLNPLFVAACHAWLWPLKLAAELPDDHPRALTEKRSLVALAKAYALAVIAGSNSEELDNYTPEEWEAWLLEHPDEFETLRTYAPVRTNFVEEDDQREPGAVGDVVATPSPPESIGTLR